MEFSHLGTRAAAVFVFSQSAKQAVVLVLALLLAVVVVSLMAWLASRDNPTW